MELASHVFNRMPWRSLHSMDFFQHGYKIRVAQYKDKMGLIHVQKCNQICGIGSENRCQKSEGTPRISARESVI